MSDCDNFINVTCTKCGEEIGHLSSLRAALEEARRERDEARNQATWRAYKARADELTAGLEEALDEVGGLRTVNRDLNDALSEAQAKITAARDWISKRQGPANHSMSDLLAILEGEK